jgi:DNA-binding response OmpR family regulator
MQGRLQALLVYGRETPLGDLKPILERQGVQTSRARSLAAAKCALGCDQRPSLVFTDTVLPDGTWAEIVSLAGRACPHVPVIVVSRLVCMSLYLKVLESGASDYIVPPFRDADLAHAVRCATQSESGIGAAVAGVDGRTLTEVRQHAANHTGSRVRTCEAQAGR